MASEPPSYRPMRGGMRGGAHLVLCMSIVGVAGAISDICYKINYDKEPGTDTYRGSQLVRPVNRWPKEHPKVAQTNGQWGCHSFTEGEIIPEGKVGCAKCNTVENNDPTSKGCTNADATRTTCITPPAYCSGNGDKQVSEYRRMYWGGGAPLSFSRARAYPPHTRARVRAYTTRNLV